MRPRMPKDGRTEADISMTDATGELLAGESGGLDGKSLEKELRERTIRERAYEI